MKSKNNKNLELNKIQISKLSKLGSIRGGNNSYTNSSNCNAKAKDYELSTMTTKTVPTDVDWM